MYLGGGEGGICSTSELVFLLTLYSTVKENAHIIRLLKQNVTLTEGRHAHRGYMPLDSMAYW